MSTSAMPWTKYAAPSAGAKPWEKYGAPTQENDVPPRGEVLPPEKPPTVAQNFQKAFDELATPPQFDIHHPFNTGAQDFGAGVIGLMSPIFHPSQTLDAAAKLLGGSTADKMSVIRPLISAFKQNPVGQGIAAIPGIASTFAAPGAEGTVRDLGEATERGGLNLGNAALGARGPKLFKYGANPARGAFEEGILPALSKHSAAMKLEGALPQVGQRVADAVSAGTPVPAGKIATSIEAPIIKAGNVMSGFGGGRSLNPVADLWAAMEEKAPNASTPIYGSAAPPKIPASDLWRSIQNLDKNTRFNPDPEVEGINEIRREMRGGLRRNLEEAAPKVKSPSRTYGDLKAAEEALDRTMHSGSGLSKMVKVPMFPVESGLGKAMFRGGQGIQLASPFARIGLESAPVATLMNALRKKKE